MTVVLLLHAASTLWMTGLIWFVQVVHYPLMEGWPHDDFGSWEARHRLRTGLVVAPGMLLEAATGAWLMVRPPRGVPRGLLFAAAGLLGGIWASTFLLQVPAHDMLDRGWDPKVHAWLVLTNWIRTVSWSGRLLLMAAAVLCLLPAEPPAEDAG